MPNVSVRGDSNPSFLTTRINNGQDSGLLVYNRGRGMFERCSFTGNFKANVAVETQGCPFVQDCLIQGGKDAGIIVNERTKEIGIRRAIGASPYSIISQVIAESILITTLAGYLGLVSGIFLMEAVNVAIQGQDTGMFHQPGVEISVALKALTILVVCGALAGIIPARKADSISPVDALRNE